MAPSLASEADLASVAKEIAIEIREDKSRHEWWTVAVNQLRSVLADLMALDLVEPSKRKHAVSDDREYWTLTAFGHEVHNHLRRSALQGTSEQPAEDESADATSDPAIAETSPPAKKTPAKKTPGKKTPGKKTPAKKE